MSDFSEDSFTGAHDNYNELDNFGDLISGPVNSAMPSLCRTDSILPPMSSDEFAVYEPSQIAMNELDDIIFCSQISTIGRTDSIYPSTPTPCDSASSTCDPFDIKSKPFNNINMNKFLHEGKMPPRYVLADYLEKRKLTIHSVDVLAFYTQYIETEMDMVNFKWLYDQFDLLVIEKWNDDSGKTFFEYLEPLLADSKFSPYFK